MQRSWTQQQIQAKSPTVVVFDTPFSIVPTLPHIRRFVLAHDVVSERAVALKRAGYSPDPSNLDANWESDRLADIDDIVAIQWDDARVLRNLAPNATVTVAPPAFSVSVRRRQSPVDGQCLLVGSGTLHNVDGAGWLIEEVWPLVLRGRPDARLHLVGSVCSQIHTADPTVQLHGEVRSLDDVYLASQIVLVPLRFGSGLKVKLVEALCYARPIVTTAVGAQGLGALGESPPFMLAETADSFARAVTALLDDAPARAEMSQRASSAARLFSPAHAHEELLRRLAS